MSTTEEIKSAISKLPRKERRRIASWVISADDIEWDEEIQKDIEGGLLEDLANEALRDHKESKSKEL